jgi:hypothetical protein
MSFFEEKIKNLINALLADLHCTPYRNFSRRETIETHILPLIDFIHST